MAILIAVAFVQTRFDYCNSLFLTCHVSISVSSSVFEILLPGLLSMIGAHPSNRFLLTCNGSPFKPEFNLKLARLHKITFWKSICKPQTQITHNIICSSSFAEVIWSMPTYSTANSNMHWPTCFPCLRANRMELTTSVLGLSPSLATFKRNLKTFYFAPS